MIIVIYNKILIVLKLFFERFYEFFDFIFKELVLIFWILYERIKK